MAGLITGCAVLKAGKTAVAQGTSLATRYGVSTASEVQYQVVGKAPSNLTPSNFFKNKTYAECQKIFTLKFGAPKPGAPGGMSFFNSKTGRTFHLHQQPGHWNGKR